MGAVVTDLLVGVALVATWGVVLVVWLAGAIYNARNAPRDRIRAAPTPWPSIVAAIAVCSIAMIFGRGVAQSLATDALPFRLVGFAVLVGSTAFALWARFALGTSWSIGPEVGGDRRLRTSGPYAVTRHPIYTGLVGMLAGTALLGGVGQWIVLVVAGLIVVELKIRMEENLLLAVFPEDYRRYRERVPQLVPGLRLPRRD